MSRPPFTTSPSLPPPPQSFLVEISAIILAKKDDLPGGEGFLVDKIVDRTGAKGTGGFSGFQGFANPANGIYGKGFRRVQGLKP
jgi:6-phosphogluconate dehydrogenase